MKTTTRITPTLALALALASCGAEDPTDATEQAPATCQEARDADGSVTITCRGSEASVQPGTDGAILSEEASIILRTDPEAPDAQGCEVGGDRVSWGRDLDFDGELGDDEVEGSRLVCAGVPGADAPVMRVEQEPLEEGSICPIGGTLVRVGYDTDGDASLSADETQGSFELCTPPCDLGFYLDTTLGACRPGQIVIVEGTITRADPFYPDAEVGDPYRFALIYDLEEEIVGDILSANTGITISSASFQLASFVIAQGELTWKPPVVNWQRSLSFLGGVRMTLFQSVGLVGEGLEDIVGIDVDVALPPGTTWPGTMLPPSRVLGTSTDGELRVKIRSESEGVIGSIDRIATPQSFDPANLLPD